MHIKNQATSPRQKFCQHHRFGSDFFADFLCSSTIYETFRILVQGSFQTVFWMFWADLLRMQWEFGKLNEEEVC